MNHANASTEIETGDSSFKLAAIIIIVFTIVASLGAFLLMVIPQEKQTFKTTGYEEPEEPEDEDETANLSHKPASAKLEGSEAAIEVQKKAAFILTHGQLKTLDPKTCTVIFLQG